MLTPEVSEKSAEEKSRDQAARIVEKGVLAKMALYAKKMAAGLGLKPIGAPVLGKLLAHIGQAELQRLIRQRIDLEMSRAEISYGVDESAVAEAVEICLQQILQGKTDMIARKIAVGDLPEAGNPARLEYLLNPDNKPMGHLENVPPISSRVWVKVVHKHDVIVQLVPAEDGKPGRNVLGERVEPPSVSGEPVHLSRIVGSNTAVEGNKLIATCEGACEENASGQIRVVPEIVVQNVDALSGSLPPGGTSQASIAVCGCVRAPYGVMTTENVFVGVGAQGGMVEKNAFVSAKNLVVNGTIQGVHDDSQKDSRVAIDVEALCATKEIDGCLLRAGALLVGGDCRRAHLEIDESVRIDGDVVGCRVVCRQVFSVAGSLGSAEGGSHTRVVIPMDVGLSRRALRLDAEMARKQKDLAVLKEKQQQIQAENAKRAKKDAYWAGLLSGQAIPPKTPVEGQTLRQFREMGNVEKKLVRAIQESLLAMRLSKEKRAEIDGVADDVQEAVVQVGGQFFLDAAIEASYWVAEDEMDAKVTYAIDGKRYRNHALRDVLQVLSRQATEYAQAREESVAVRTEALDKMFEGREQRPSGPTIAHKAFELDLVWADVEDEGASPLKLDCRAVVHTSEPKKMKLVAVAALREVMRGVAIRVSREGARVKFALSAGQVSRWRGDANAIGLLDQVVIRGLSGRRVLDGEALPDIPGSATETTRL